MPYILNEQRLDLNVVCIAETPGQLNFLLTQTCLAYMNRGHKGYQEINDIVGALECCKQEFYRRVAVPYEEIKMKENGDVY